MTTVAAPCGALDPEHDATTCRACWGLDPETAPEPPTPPKHPAKWSQPVLDAIAVNLAALTLPAGPRILDPFAGVGLDRLAATLPEARWTGLELEPEWARQAARTLAGDATRMPFPEASFDGVCTSPTYGNRMADTYDGRGQCRACAGEGIPGGNVVCERCGGMGRDQSRRMTYRIALGRMPRQRSTAVLAWGTTYRALHRMAWHECHRVIRPGGYLLVNVSNHLRTKGSGQKRQQSVQHVMEWHVDCLASLGFVLQRLLPVQTARMRQGANHEARVDAEHLLVMVRP